MSLSLKKMVRDTLVDDATIQSLLGVTTTGSAAISPAFMERSGVQSQIIYQELDGIQDPGMDSENGLITFSVEVEAGGGQNPHLKYELIHDRIQELLDDTSVAGTSVSGTASYTFLFSKAGGPGVIYNPKRKVYTKMVSYSYKILKG